MYEEVKNAKRIVVKVGTSTLAYAGGRLNIRRMESLVRVLADLKNMGKEIILVTSGAIGVGAGEIGLAERPRETMEKQAAAAVGQCELMYTYSKMFGEYGHNVAQILLTRDIIEVEQSKFNAKNTIFKLLEYGVIPIVNENDTICTKEVEFGDNDTLSAIVAVLAEAQALIILTDIAGVYDSDPRTNKDAKMIEVIDDIESVMYVAKGAGTKQGTGGMVTKLEAGKIAKSAGIHTIIAGGCNPKRIYDIIEGKPYGTFIKGK